MDKPETTEGTWSAPVSSPHIYPKSMVYDEWGEVTPERMVLTKILTELQAIRSLLEKQNAE